MPRSGSPRRRTAAVPDGLAVLIGVGIVALCWMFLMPPGSGPDEPGHLTRAGAVIRGDFADENYYSLPDRYQVAEPFCYAFQPTVPVSCSETPVHSGATIDLPTNAGPYPIWGHLIEGAPTLLPGPDPIWWARLAGVAIATVLVGAAIVQLTLGARAAVGGLLLGLTPMAWSTFGTVNPSSIAIAGAVALWTGLLVRADREPSGSWLDAGWLTAIGWVALVLPRRDGLVWACIALVVALAAGQRTTPAWWRSLNRPQQALIAGSTIVIVVWAALSGVRSTQFLVTAPLLIPAGEGWRWWWNRPVQTAATRWVSATIAAIVALLAAYVAIGTRPGGWDTDLAVDVVMQTDDNLWEAIGVLGWLDAVVPTGVVYLWLIALGMLVAAALTAQAHRIVCWALALTGATIVSSWVLELVQGNTSGTYWQGRYSLPLVVGIPLLLAVGDRRPTDGAANVHRVVGATALLIVNIAAWAAARRFGVGTAGSLLPWRWNTPIQPIPPVLILLVHAVATVWMASILFRPAPTASTDG